MSSKEVLDGNAIVYCEGFFNTPEGKTAHGLVRFTERYRVLSVIDSRYAGQDAGILYQQDGLTARISRDTGQRGMIAIAHIFGQGPDDKVFDQCFGGGRKGRRHKRLMIRAAKIGIVPGSGF